MKSYLTNQKGSALIVILVVLVVAAALVYGSSFFWPKNPNSPAGTAPQALNTLKQAQDDIKDVQDSISQRTGVSDIAEIKEWDTLNRDKDGFAIDYPHGWYYNANHTEARGMGYILIIGFEPSNAIWGTKPPYDIELVVMDKDSEMEEVPGRIIKQLGESENKYILLTYEGENGEIVEKMAESFILTNQTTKDNEQTTGLSTSSPRQDSEQIKQATGTLENDG